MKKKTLKIDVIPTAVYLPQESSPDNQRFMWTYEVTIKNESEEIVQLLNRHWRITDMSGKVDEVRGPGVIGLQPLIKPGKQFVYSSFCQLYTPHGSMEGYYEMQDLDEVRFLVKIPKFQLISTIVQAADRSKLH